MRPLLAVVLVTLPGVNGHSFHEELTHKAEVPGATALMRLRLVQSQFQWNQRTSLLVTAIKEAG